MSGHSGDIGVRQAVVPQTICEQAGLLLQPGRIRIGFEPIKKVPDRIGKVLPHADTVDTFG
jgi:hypothetical protein